MEFENQIIKKFKEIKQEIEDLKPDPSYFRTHVLPLARIKKIMKLDEDVKMISAETPLLISKACELFIIELAYRGWIHTIESNRRTLQRNDIAQAISHNDFYDFLLDIVEESCKNKLFYSAHSYSKNPSIPTFGLFDNFHLNMINDQEARNININNNFMNIKNFEENYFGSNKNNNNNMTVKNDLEEENSIKENNLQQSTMFFNQNKMNTSRNISNLFFK